MNNLDQASVMCPYCGEMIELQLDLTAADEEYIQDCSVCCRPITLHVTCDADGAPSVSAKRDSD